MALLFGVCFFLYFLKLSAGKEIENRKTIGTLDLEI